MVAPNSPIALAKARMAPATIPGKISGSVTTTNVHARLAPSVAAASSSRESTASIASQIARTISGKAMIAAASAAPVQRKAKTIPRSSARKLPNAPWRPNRISKR